jgi:hypothetical protein
VWSLVWVLRVIMPPCCLRSSNHYCQNFKRQPSAQMILFALVN